MSRNNTPNRAAVAKSIVATGVTLDRIAGLLGEILRAVRGNSAQPANPQSVSPPPAPPVDPPNFPGPIGITRVLVRMDPKDGAAIRRDAKTMAREDVYVQWTAPNGTYTRHQVASAIAWGSGKLRGRATTRAPRRRPNRVDGATP